MNRLKKWDTLPEFMKNEQVLKYYKILENKRISLFFKRLIDFFLSLFLLLILGPFLLLVTILIKVDSSGPAMFRQVRVTQYGKEFKIFKFRTMVVDAEVYGSLITANNDQRITRVGSIIRKYRIDELPQLLNVLKGEMTFVGVRPEVPRYVSEYTDEMYATLLLPAGVTSQASIHFKNEDKLLSGVKDIDFSYVNVVLPHKMTYNLESLKKYSLMNDFKVLLCTIIAVIR